MKNSSCRRSLSKNLKLTILSFFIFCIFVSTSKDNNSEGSLNEGWRELLVPKDFKMNSDFHEAICEFLHTVEAKRRPVLDFIWALEDGQDRELLEMKQRIFECELDEVTVRHDYYADLSILSRSKRVFNIVIIDKFSTFKILDRELTKDNFNFRGFFLFVMLKGKFKEYEQVTKMLYDKKIVRAAFLYENKEQGSLQFDRISVFQNGQCWSSKPMKVVEFKNGKFLSANFEILKRHFNNLYGCKVVVPTYHRPPSMVIDGKTKEMKGFDMRILRWLSKKLNFKIKEIRITGMNPRGSYDPITETLTGALKELYQGEAHIAIGGYILRSNRSQFFDFSSTYFTTPLVVSVPPGDRFTSFEQLVKPFDKFIWGTMILMFIMSMLVIFIIHFKFKRAKDFVYGQKIRTPVINIIIAIVGGSQKKLPRQNFARFVLMMLVVFCLVQRNVYQGLLYIFITGNQRHPEIQTLREMQERNFTFYVFPPYAGLSPENRRSLVFFISKHISFWLFNL